MTSRQRILDTFAGKPTDRVPVVPFVYNNVINEAHGGVPEDPIAACAAYYKKFGFDMILRNFVLSDYYDERKKNAANWQVTTEVIGEHDVSWEEKTTITTPARQLTQTQSFRRVTANYVVDATMEYFIKDYEDFEQFKKYQPELGVCDCTVITHARAVVANDGVVATNVHGAFNTAAMYRDLTELLMDACVDAPFYHEMMTYFMERLLGFIRQAVSAGTDIINSTGNMANGSMAGHRLFSEFVMPYENRVIDAIHEAGGLCMYHNCGDAKRLLPYYNQMKMDMYESLTAPPYGDTLLEEALSVMQPPKVLSGNLDQIDFLVNATPEQVRMQVKKVLEAVKPRGHFILAASDFLSEGTPEANLHALMDAALEYGRY